MATPEKTDALLNRLGAGNVDDDTSDDADTPTEVAQQDARNLSDAIGEPDEPPAPDAEADIEENLKAWRDSEPYLDRNHPDHEKAVQYVAQQTRIEAERKGYAEGNPSYADVPVPEPWKDDPAWLDTASICKECGVPSDVVREIVNLAEQHGVEYSWTPERAEAVLRRQWGAEFDTNLAQAEEAINRYPGLMEHLERSGLVNNPRLIQLAALLAAKSGDAQDEINEILADKTHPYWRTWGPERDAAREEVARLYREAYPG